jgi:hypothetical protein
MSLIQWVHGVITLKVCLTYLRIACWQATWCFHFDEVQI